MILYCAIPNQLIGEGRNTSNIVKGLLDFQKPIIKSVGKAREFIFQLFALLQKLDVEHSTDIND